MKLFGGILDSEIMKKYKKRGGGIPMATKGFVKVDIMA